MILSIDQGTTSSRALLFDTAMKLVHTEQKELTLTYPHKGWVEQDPSQIWQDTLDCVRGCAAKSDKIEAIGITNQRETTLVWDRKTGKAVYNAIVWQDRRTADMCKEFKVKGHEALVQEKTGLLLDPYFSATKLRWILENVDGARARAEAGELCFGTIDSFLIWKLTDGASHVTDITNASRTMLFNIQTCQWDEELCAFFDIPLSLLPEVKDNVDDFGQTQHVYTDHSVPICGSAGDQQAAAIGQACFAPGMIKSTYGTGCFVLMNTGATLKKSKNKLLSTIAYRINGQTSYAVEGSIFVAGAAIQWLRDNLGFFEKASESETLALSVPDTNGVVFVPAFTGLGAPHWNPEARAAITGLTRESNKAHITRAALDAQAFQTHDLMAALAEDGGYEIERLRVDGGLVANAYMCQTLADILDKPVDVPSCIETTALGAAYLAGLGCGWFKDIDDIQNRWSHARTFTADMNEQIRKSRLREWQTALEKI